MHRHRHPELCQGDGEEAPVDAVPLQPSCFTCVRVGRDCKKTSVRKVLSGFRCDSYFPIEEPVLEARDIFITEVGLKLALKTLARPATTSKRRT